MLDDLEIDVSPTSLRKFPDVHLQSPIRNSSRRIFITLWEHKLRGISSDPPVAPFWISRLTKTLEEPCGRRPISEQSEVRYGHYLSHRSVSFINDSRCAEYQNDLMLTNSIIRSSLQFLSDRMDQKLTPSLITEDYFQHCGMWRFYHTMRQVWEHIRDVMYSKQQVQDFSWKVFDSKYLKLSLLISSHFIVDISQSGAVLLDYEQVLGITDTIISRGLVICYSMLVPTQNNIIAPSTDSIVKFFDLFDFHFKSLGNNVYKYIKHWEPIWAGYLIKITGTLQFTHSFFDVMVSDLRELDREYGVTITDQLLELINDIENPIVASELHGMFRLWMHPTVDEAGGCETMRSRSRNHSVKSNITLDMMLGAFNRTLVSQFLVKHGRWPKCFVYQDSPVSPSFIKMVKEKPTHFRDTHFKESLIQWSYLHFGPEFEFDYQADYTDLLDDKAVSVPRSYYDSVYNRQLLGYDPPKPPTSRRLMEVVLNMDTFDIQSICDQIMRDQVPENWYTVGLHAKERELKIKPRLFAMLPLEMRCWLAVTEKNLVTLLDYFPSQTMTMSEAELVHHLLNITKPQQGDRTIPFFVNIDFEGWCSSWDQTMTMEIFQRVEELFDTPGLYTFTHRFFEKSYYYLVSNMNPPTGLTRDNRDQYPETDLTWKGQEGGCEGLRQKGWTTCTICLLSVVQQRTGIMAIITGQGDNQVLLINVPVRAEWKGEIDDYKKHCSQMISDDVNHYMDILVSTAKEVGLIIKRQETWISENVMMYSKDIIVNGAVMPSSIKRLARLYGENNEMFPSLSSKISTLHTCGQAAAQKGVHFAIPYMMVGAEVLRVFSKETVWSHFLGGGNPKLKSLKAKMDPVLKIILLTIPRILGGFPVSPLFEYLYRGHPDPLTSALSFLKTIGEDFPIVLGVINYVENHMEIPKVDPLMLIKDPTSLNLKVPVLSSNILKNTVEEVIIPSVKNKDVRTLFHMDDPEEEAEVLKTLLAIRPVTPRVLNDIFRSSSLGVRLNFISKFNNMRTTKELLPPATQSTLISRMQIAEINWILSIFTLRKISEPLTNYTIDCTMQLAMKLRATTWNIPEGLEGVSVPHPSEQFVLKRVQPECCSLCCLVREHIVYVCTGSENILYERGPATPYIGSKTSEKVSSKLIIAPKTDKPLAAAQRLLRISEWLGSSSEQLQEFLVRLIKSRTDIPIQILNMMTGVHYGGSPTHRFADVTTKHQALVNQRPNIHTSIYISSDLLGSYSRGFDNYTMHFQGIYLWDSAIIGLDRGIMNPCKGRTTYHSHVACLKCCKKLGDETLSLTIDKIPEIKVYSDCKLLFSQVSECKIISHAQAKQHLSYENLEKGKVSLVSSVFACMLLGDALRRRGYNVFLSNQPSMVSSPSKISPSIADIMSIGIRHIVRGVGQLLFLDNLIDILHACLIRHCEMPEAVMAIVSQFSEILWDTIVNTLLLPDFNLLIVLGTENLPSSSEHHVRGYSLQACLTRLAMKHIVRIINDKLTLRPLFASTYGYGPLRIYRAWVNSVLWNGYCDGAINMTQMVKCIRQVCQKSSDLKQPLIDGDTILIQTLVDQKCERMADRVYRDWKCRVSLCGPEVWLAANRSEIPKIKRVRFPENQVITFEQMTPYIKVDIPSLYLLEHRMVTIPNRVEEQEPTLKLRSDHYFRSRGVYSTAPYKYLEILASLNISSAKSVVCLAEGSGGLVRMFLDIFQADLVMYNSLRDIFSHTAHRGINYLPAEIERSKNSHKVIGVQTSLSTGGDLTDDVVIQQYISLWKIKSKDLFDILTCDAETSGSFDVDISLKIATAVVKVASALGKLGSIIIFKTFCSHPPLLEAQIHLLSQLGRVTLMVPHSSSNESFEIFLVIQMKEISNNLVYSEINQCPMFGFSMEISEICNHLSESRTEDLPLQLANIGQIDTITRWLISAGFEDNSLSSYRRLTNDLDINPLPAPHELSHRFNQLLSTISIAVNNRASAFENVLRTTYFSKAKIIRAKDHVESHAVIYLLQPLVNLNCLIAWCRLRRRDDVIMEIERPVVIQLEEKIYFEYQMGFEEWSKVFARAFWHVASVLDREDGITFPLIRPCGQDC